jgi:hypothetical protein
MDMSLVQWILVGGFLTLYAFILAVMVRRKIRPRFPIFFGYIALSSVTMCGLNVGAKVLPNAVYFWVFWLLQTLLVGLSFGVLREVFVNLLKPFSAVIDLGKMMFWWAALFLLFAAGLTAAATSGSHPDKLTAAILLLVRSVQMMQCGLLLLLVIFERRLGISWRSHGMCIALGLGVYAAGSLAMCQIGGLFQGWDGVEELAQSLLALGVVLIWAISLALPAPALDNALDSPKRLILQRWDEALASHGYGSPALASSTSTVESFLPGIEKTVDRVMARKAVS